MRKIHLLPLKTSFNINILAFRRGDCAKTANSFLLGMEFQII